MLLLLFSLSILVLLRLLLIKLLSMFLGGCGTVFLHDQLVVKVLEFSEEGESIHLEFGLLGLVEGVICHLQDLELGQLQLVQVLNCLLVISDLIRANRQHVQLLQGLETLKLRDVIGEQGKVGELSELFETLYLLDEVK